MSGSGQNEESAKDDSGEAGRDMHRPKNISTAVRVLTVLAYLLSVSMAAILLSVYYVFVWKSPEVPSQNVARLSARQGDLHEYQQNFTADYLAFGYQGRSNTTVNENTTDQSPSNLLEPIYDSTREPARLDLPGNTTSESTSQQTPQDYISSSDSESNTTNI